LDKTSDIRQGSADNNSTFMILAEPGGLPAFAATDHELCYHTDNALTTYTW